MAEQMSDAWESFDVRLATESNDRGQHRGVIKFPDEGTILRGPWEDTREAAREAARAQLRRLQQQEGWVTVYDRPTTGKVQ